VSDLGVEMSRFECPRCGAGVRPNDIQCGRCGETLREREALGEYGEEPKITLESVFSQRETSVRLNDSEYVTVSRMRKLLERREQDLLRREKELNERETELLESLEEIEGDTLALESAMENLQNEEASLAETEKALRERESDLERISNSLSQWREVMSRFDGMMEGDELTPTDLEKLIEIQENFQQVLDKERGRLKLELKEELSDEIETLALKEEQFRVTESALMKKTIELRNMLRDRALDGERKEEDLDDKKYIDELKQKTFSEISKQIGIGIEGEVNEVLIPTHIERLDHILKGGIPKGHVILVNGPVGSMKSSLAYHILHHCAADQGIRGMYFSLEQNRASILRQMERIGLSREESRENLILVDMVDLRKAMAGEDGDWRSILMRYVKNVKEAKDFDLFVLDSLESFKAMSEFVFSREDLAELFDWFRDLGLTTFLVSEKSPRELLKSSQGELYLSDGAIDLVMHENRDKVHRWIRIPKMRGVDIDPRYFSFFFDGRTFQLHSPLASTSE
jgi:KaiC/GvpD/RAD55 family RecA-like ATPase/ribosomal protein S27AE